jgi:pantoate--beta-alanine ligase
MKIVETVPDLREMRRALPGSVGFVPTMGYLHEGHLTLVRRAQQENSSVILSIFVNPTQFGPHEDFNNYPRNIERDLISLERLNPDIVFIPSKEEIYPADFSSWIEIGDISQKLEGKYRPGHFKGVCTVVAKLFNIAEPTRAYFGQKDAQQALVIQKMVADLNMNLEVVVVPTVREEDGLAMSSRNTYLSAEERKAAAVLFKSLSTIQDMWRKGAKSADILRQKMVSIITQEKLASIEYISIANIRTLDELEIINGPALVSMAVRIGKTRLIDNIILK